MIQILRYIVKIIAMKCKMFIKNSLISFPHGTSLPRHFIAAVGDLRLRVGLAF